MYLESTKQRCRNCGARSWGTCFVQYCTSLFHFVSRLIDGIIFIPSAHPPLPPPPVSITYLNIYGGSRTSPLRPSWEVSRKFLRATSLVHGPPRAPGPLTARPTEKQMLQRANLFRVHDNPKWHGNRFQFRIWHDSRTPTEQPTTRTHARTYIYFPNALLTVAYFNAFVIK